MDKEIADLRFSMSNLSELGLNKACPIVTEWREELVWQMLMADAK